MKIKMLSTPEIDAFILLAIGWDRNMVAVCLFNKTVAITWGE